MLIFKSKSKPTPLPTDSFPAPTLAPLEERPSISEPQAEAFTKLFRANNAQAHPSPKLDDAVRFQDHQIPIHPSWATTPLSRAIENNKLNLNKLTTEMLAELSPRQLKTLTGILAMTDVGSEIHSPQGQRMSMVEIRARKIFRRPQKLNGATALVLKTVLSGDTEVMTRTVASAPSKALPLAKLESKGQELFTGENLIRVLREMKNSAFGDGLQEITPDELATLGELAKLSLEKAQDHLGGELSAAVKSLFKEFDDAKLDSSPENLGILAGAIVAGLAKIDKGGQQTSHRTKRLTNHAWAASWLAGPLAGVASTLIVGLGDAYASLQESTELTDMARYRRNRLESHWLQNPPSQWSFEDRTTAMQWVDLTIRSNRVNV